MKKTELNKIAKEIIKSNIYLTLATLDALILQANEKMAVYKKTISFKNQGT